MQGYSFFPWYEVVFQVNADARCNSNKAYYIKSKNLHDMKLVMIPNIMRKWLLRNKFCVAKLKLDHFCDPLPSSRRRSCIHANILPIDNRRTFKHAFRFLCVWTGDLSTRHAWRAIVAPDLYTRNHFSESMGSRLGGPGQKARQTMNEFTLFVDFCLIPLSFL